ncbi:MAG: sulfotransferase [Chlorobi bacterium]|nr:sulfotransferase [Chlorobiota bacterium]
MVEKKPNLFIVGAAKAGTTSLYRILEASADVYHSPVKEPNFFSADIKPELFSHTYKKQSSLNEKKYFAKVPLGNKQLAFIRNEDYYKQLFEASKKEKYRAESSTSYLYSAVAAKNIYNYNPGSKIIILLRNPVERAFSHYLMALRYGFTTLSFKEALEKDIQKEKKGWGISELFIELGEYYKQVKRYYEVFPKENIGVFLFDELEKNPEAFYQSIFKFLNISFFNTNLNEIHNKAKVPKMKKLNKLVVNSGIKNLSKTILPEILFEKMKQKAFKENTDIKLDKNTKNRLLDVYKTDIENTAGLINVDLSKWINN